jgi:1-acyl-sn-glycerol-3-phosphate acyltransferase
MATRPLTENSQPRTRASEEVFRLIRGVFVDAAIIFYTGAAASLAVLAALTTRSGRSVYAVERVWSRLVVRVCGMRLDVEGLEQLAPDRSYVIISNHQSHLDICATMVGLGRKILFVTKRELLDIPVFGRALVASHHIVIDRNDSQSAIRTVNTAVRDSPDGSCILFYAEGTRSPDGSILPFKKGGVTLALQTGLPIVPLTISGTRRLLPKGARFVRPGGSVRLCIAPPIETAGMPIEARDDLTERIRTIIAGNRSAGD